MSGSSMQLGLVQMSPGHDKQQNINQAASLIDACMSAERPDLIVLPEMWTCLGGDSEAKFLAAETIPAVGSDQPGGGAFEFLRHVARTRGIHVHCGSIGERRGDRLLNTSIVFGPDGTVAGRYSKIHLFDVTTPTGTGYRESDMYLAGESITTIDLAAPFTDIRLGLAICYDLRFSELFYRLRKDGANLILLPAAFTAETGEAHWEVLLRARAIETQCWVGAAGTVGGHRDGSGRDRYTFGNSMIIDPWGSVTSRASSGQGWVTGRVDIGRVTSIRQGIPVMDHRRLM